jgi:hypothetical protein
MARGPDFFKQMSVEQIDALEEFARHRGKSVDDVTGYLADLQIRTSRSAVGRWLQDFRMWDRSNRAKEIAKSYMQAAAGDDDAAVADASLRKFNELLFETLASGEELDTGDLLKISVALKTGLGARQLVNDIKTRGVAQLNELKGEANKRAITAEDIERVSKAVFG